MKIKITAIILASVAVLLLSFGCADRVARNKLDKSVEMQNGRADTIRELTQKGLIAKIDDHPHSVELWVKPLWYTIDFNKKDFAANIVYSFYFDGTSLTDKVIIVDAMTGKAIGQYSVATGGLHLND